MNRDDLYYQAMLARDYRFDGKFFVGVTTTGIYCRPICPAKPKRENVIFYDTGLAAEQAGFRPCLRCHPEAAPGTPAWSGRSTLIQRTLQLLASEEAPLLKENDFARHLGVTPRHLRRLFQNEFGQTPQQLMRNNRLNFARKLVVETQLPLLTLALTAGFGSLRRFNTAFKERFGRPPSELRRPKSIPSGPHSAALELTLPYRPPYHWRGIITFLATQQIAGVETITPNSYERIFCLQDQVGWLRLTPDPHTPQLRLQVICPDPRLLFGVVQRLRTLFDLDADPLLIANAFAQSPTLDTMTPPGLRLPGCWDGFETAVCIVLGQLVSLKWARELVAILVKRYGPRVTHPLTGETLSLFPDAARLAAAGELDLPTTRQRRLTLQRLAQAVARGEISLSRAQDPQAFRQQVLALPGIGPWTADNFALRVLGDTDAFPATDLILKRSLVKFPELDLSTVQPWRGYAALSLWENHLSHLTTQES
ncbi:MAG: AlkA N-terminal domain-containing protein [Candidatus Sericytochromatia bacterium]